MDCVCEQGLSVMIGPSKEGVLEKWIKCRYVEFSKCTRHFKYW
jgi:hypothetical protein